MKKTVFVLIALFCVITLAACSAMVAQNTNFDEISGDHAAFYRTARESYDLLANGEEEVTENTSAPAASEPTSYQLGDVNKDGKITNLDILKLFKYIYNPELYPLEGAPVVPEDTTEAPTEEETTESDETASSEGLTYELNTDGNSYSVIGYTGTHKKVIIPETYEDKPVTVIGDYAFEKCDVLSSITIPDGVISIGNYAFSECENLENVNIGENSKITSIGAYAFYGCTKLVDINIPEGVTDIRDYTFCGCFSLTEISLPDGLVSIGDQSFGPCIELKNITIPASVTSIGSGAFSKCYSVESITVEEGNPVYHSVGNCLIETDSKTLILGCQSSVIPDDGSVTIIGNSAFYGCINLISITIPDGITSIVNYAFSNCSHLSEINIPDSVTQIGQSAFSGCQEVIQKEKGVSYVDGWAVGCDSSVTSVTLRDSTRGIAEWAFRGCTSLTSVTIGNSVTSIGDSAFYGCSSLTSITIPDSVISIGDWAFCNCSSLETVYFTGTEEEWAAISIDDSNYCLTDANIIFNYGKEPVEEETTEAPEEIPEVVYIDGFELTLNDDKASYGVNAYTGTATEVVIPSACNGLPVTSISGRYVFEDRADITSITIPEGITSIGYAAFMGCSGLSSIDIPDSVTYIDDWAFAFCSGLYSVEIPYGITSINDCTFYECVSLMSVSIPETVTYIGEAAFLKCAILMEINIPDGVTEIGERAFFECDSLTSVVIPDSVLSIGGHAFTQCDSLESVTLPRYITEIGDWTFGNCNNLVNVNIPEGVTRIGEYAFYYCDSITGLTIPDGVISIGDEAFHYCGINSIEIPASVSEIEGNPFVGIEDITASIDNQYFHMVDGCLIEKSTGRLIHGLGIVGNKIPDDVTEIEYGAFNGCDFASIEIPEGVVRIGGSAFANCRNLTNITIPASTTIIGSGAFTTGGNIETITFKNTEGWFKTKAETATVGIAIDVSDPKANANILDPFKGVSSEDYYWKRTVTN